MQDTGSSQKKDTKIQKDYTYTVLYGIKKQQEHCVKNGHTV